MTVQQVFALETLNDVLVGVGRRGAHEVMLSKDGAGLWQPITAEMFYARVRSLAAVFRGWGVGKGDRVAILAENRWEWTATDFATLALGAVDVPLYATLPADQIGYMLKDSGARVVVVSSREQYDKVRSCTDLPDLQHVVVMDAGEFAGAEAFAALIADADGAAGTDGWFEESLRSVRSDDLATIIYTSGTTGDPKGAMLTHGNLASNLNFSTLDFDFNDADSWISFLPLSHVTARHLDYVLLCYGAKVAYCPKFDELSAAMKAVRPTVFVAVPRVYEKIRQAVEGKARASKVRSRILAWAVETGGSHRDQVLAGETPGALSWTVAKKLVFGKIRDAFGGRVHTFVSGGAPLGIDTATWFADVGVLIFEGYGLTETSPVVALASPKAHRIGTVGPVLPNVEHRFAADGELEVRGPSVTKGYWNKETATREAFTLDGWFKTGDIGELDSGKFLTITDRKKELLKTSGGKLIAPQPIENKLKANHLVGQAALVGDKHKFAAVLISPNFEALEAWAKDQGVATADRPQLVTEEKVRTLYQGIVDEVNGRLAHHETMKRVQVVPDEWSVEDGELTPSMKLKRRVIEAKYKSAIDGFYQDEASSGAA